MVCIIRGEPSAVPKLWVGAIVATGANCLLPLAGRSVLDYVIERTRPQISELVICPADNPASYVRYGCPVVEAEFSEAGKPPGLLAHILAGLEWTAAHSRETAWLATFPAHVPVFPMDLVARLGHAIGSEGADMAWAVPGERSEPAFGLWPVRLRRRLRRSLVKEPGLGLNEWAARYRPARVAFSPATEPFVPVHGPDDLTTAAVYLTPDSVNAPAP